MVYSIALDGRGSHFSLITDHLFSTGRLNLLTELPVDFFPIREVNRRGIRPL